MTNDIRTRRLIVTLPNASGEEADVLASDIARIVDDESPIRFGRVEHALDDAPLDGWPVRVFGPEVSLARLPIPPSGARKLAALLLRAADEAEGQR